MTLFMLEISMSLWPDKCYSYWIVWHKKEEMCLVPGVTYQLIVSRGGGRGEDNSFGKLTGLLLFVTAACPRAGWSATPQPSLTPTPTWPVTESQIKPKGTWRPHEEEQMLQICETQVLQKERERWFLLMWDFTSLVPNYVLYELEVMGRNPDLTIVRVNFVRNFKWVIQKQITVNENVHPKWLISTFKYLFLP